MAETTLVACPSCGKRFKLAAEKLGRTFRCPACQVPFKAEAVTAAVTTSPPTTSPPTTSPPTTSPLTSPPPARPAAPPPPVSPPPVPSQVDPPPPSVERQTPTDRPPMSVASVLSLIFGLLFFIPLSGLVAIGLGIVGLNKTAGGRARGRGMAVGGIVVGCCSLVFSALLISILLPAFNRARQVANEVKCQKDLKQIGQAFLVYQNNNHQMFPPDLATLCNNSTVLTPNLFVCPETPDTPATSLSQVSGTHLSYVYAAAGCGPKNPPPGGVVMYDKPGNHGNDPVNVLLDTGMVERWSQADLDAHLATKP